jgi:tetratricopeptide (TPR) repeat protein
MPNKFGSEKKTMRTLWEQKSYREIFDMSGKTLEASPMDYETLVLHGFSAYQLAIAQITEPDKVYYIDECIQSLRKTLIIKSDPAKNDLMDGYIFYMLGKAYYKKGADYADFVVKYLEGIQGQSLDVDDIPEHLGLVYALLHDYENSVRAFSFALSSRDPPSDALLLAMAHSYIELDELDSATAYLMRCIETSKDYKAMVQARLLLGNIFFRQGDHAAAKEQYTAILDGMYENAEAHFQLGEIYVAENNRIAARAEWRKAVRADSTHKMSLSRLSAR